MATINIALAYADGDRHYYQELILPHGTTLYQALVHAGWLSLPTFIDFGAWCDTHMTADPSHKAWYVGIYSQKKRLDTVLSNGDRVEIYRPLSYDPMARRKCKSKVRLKKLGYRPL
ncbi:RnfH family protein [Moraxella bovis]|uniref:UPF0125 protein LP092_13365 n=1 Tax=Moraxella bovis TaxID=476 RepID=A0AAQ2T2T6_MORBO|nr:RnfH family protein [Moraxella bovis]UYZ68286.1 RnfH family protein [Moraxella bovis]UYZ70659.1 RnfH family protein [Moraxella bovis]UYZ73407.1 RnfH family protein [Moraxella bovis]UYZ75989.1 RnfH family protein [Moraxella bovis]UYZ78058.1 RnfH family protein [Moraxella bovis]